MTGKGDCRCLRRSLQPAASCGCQMPEGCDRVYIPARVAACGGRARLHEVAGLRRPQAAARTVLTDRSRFGTSPPRRRACSPHGLCKADSHPRHARSRADGLARADLRDASSSPPPGGGCGLPTSTTSHLSHNTSATTDCCGLPTSATSHLSQNRRRPAAAARRPLMRSQVQQKHRRPPPCRCPKRSPRMQRETIR